MAPHDVESTHRLKPWPTPTLRLTLFMSAPLLAACVHEGIPELDAEVDESTSHGQLDSKHASASSTNQSELDPDLSSSATPSENTPSDEDTGVGPECYPGHSEELCAEGYKCSPAKQRPEDPWASARTCIPITGDLQMGDHCIRDGDAPHDDCAIDLWCYTGNSAGSGPGVCEPLCDAFHPHESCQDMWCFGPEYACAEFNLAAVTQCRFVCDPLAQDCESGHGCFYHQLDIYLCWPDESEGAGLEGDPCDRPQRCRPGLDCIPDPESPICTTNSCCTPHCDLTAVDPDAPCTADGSRCLPHYDNPDGPAGYCGFSGR